MGDHPRVCGEKTACMYWAAPATGSPPRMRGKGTVVSFISANPGITPAYAGKRAGSSGNYSTAGDHPRVCGEKSSVFVFCDLPIGSPPRMRGKVIGCIQMVVGAGITPAYAGKSAQHVGCPPSPWGSPPRMRGKGISLHRIAHHWGITPAYAGKRTKGVIATAPAADHPRVCGEKVALLLIRPETRGSPPRMRGKD